MFLSRGSRIFPNFTKAIDLNNNWPFSTLLCTFVIIWWPEFENYWPWTSGHCILEALFYL